MLLYEGETSRPFHKTIPRKARRIICGLFSARKELAHAHSKAFAESRKTTAKKHQEENIKLFTFYDIYYAPIKALDDKQAAKFFRMICNFLDGNRR